MSAVARCTCVMLTLAVAGARLYDRCELAQDLLRLGVSRDHLATWVCIAYHESRLETDAYNPSSADHGLLQISELYWCGAGKACGMPCAALRDDDIADDVHCAQQIYDEHTRLQGDGFLAWVVYPLHCQQNVKKYLADCDTTLKYHVHPRQFNRARVFYTTVHNSNYTFVANPKIDDLKPPYYVNSLVANKYNSDTFKQRKTGRTHWLDFRVSNIDQLTLPVFTKTPEIPTTSQSITSTILTTTSTTTEVPMKPDIRILNNTIHQHPSEQREITSTTMTSIIHPDPFAESYLEFRRRHIKTSNIKQIESKLQEVTTTTVTSRNIPNSFTESYQELRRRHMKSETMLQEIQSVEPTPSVETIENSKAPFTTIDAETSAPTLTTNKTTEDVTEAITKKLQPSTEMPTKTETSVFDLYLNTKRPKVSTYSFAPFTGKRVRLNIFLDGSTTPLPKLSSHGPKAPVGGAARNHFRRQTLLQT